MNINLALAGYVLPGMAVVFGFPMALGLVPPNQFCGFRTRKTLSSPEVWHPANRVCGWSLVIAGIVAIAVNAQFQLHHAGSPPLSQQFFMSISTGALLLLAMVISAIYLQKL
jgi:uncharacterized membrane protein